MANVYFDSFEVNNYLDQILNMFEKKHEKYGNLTNIIFNPDFFFFFAFYSIMVFKLFKVVY